MLSKSNPSIKRTRGVYFQAVQLRLSLETANTAFLTLEKKCDLFRFSMTAGVMAQTYWTCLFAFYVTPSAESVTTPPRLKSVVAENDGSQEVKRVESRHTFKTHFHSSFTPYLFFFFFLNLLQRNKLKSFPLVHASVIWSAAPRSPRFVSPGIAAGLHTVLCFCPVELRQHGSIIGPQPLMSSCPSPPLALTNPHYCN